MKASGKNFTTPLKERGKIERRLEKLEKLIEETENELSILGEKINSEEVFSNYLMVIEVQGQIDEITLKQGEYMSEWAELSDKLASLD